jgi:hypothetical protein
MPIELPGELSKESRDAARFLVWMSALFSGGVLVAYLVTADWSPIIPRDGTSLVVGRDFLNFWMYGRTAFTGDPSRFYDAQLYNGELRALLGGPYPGQNWSYPPSVMLLAAPFGRLSYLHALLAWTLFSLVLFIAVARRVLTDRQLLIALLLSPAAVFGLVSGQSSLVTTAMMIGIFAWLDRRPQAAGLLIGLLSLKPQLGLLFPVMLAASGRWRVFFVAALTVLGIAALTAALFGPQVWIDFATKGIMTQNVVLHDPRVIAAPFMPTIFMNMRSVGAGYDLAMAVQLCFTAAAVVIVFWAFRFRRNADPLFLMALFFACAVFGSPYLLIYDTLPLTFAALLLIASGKLDATGIRLALLVFWLPALQLALGSYKIPGPALIAPALAIYVVMRLLESAATSSQRTTVQLRS